MPATEPLCHLVGISPAKLTKEEYLILEVELFTRICEELKEGFKIKYKNYFRIPTSRHIFACMLKPQTKNFHVLA